MSVARASLASETEQVEDAGGDHFVIMRGIEFVMKAFEGGSVAFVVGPLDLLDDSNGRSAGRVRVRPGVRLGLSSGRRQQVERCHGEQCGESGCAQHSVLRRNRRGGRKNGKKETGSGTNGNDAKAAGAVTTLFTLATATSDRYYFGSCLGVVSTSTDFNNSSSAYLSRCSPLRPMNRWLASWIFCSAP